jgi:hypothetical protein
MVTAAARCRRYATSPRVLPGGPEEGGERCQHFAEIVGGLRTIIFAVGINVYTRSLNKASDLNRTFQNLPGVPGGGSYI